MKKLILFSLALISASIVVAAPANRPNAKNTRSGKEEKGIHPWNVTENNRNKLAEEDANWSLLLHGGFNVFDGDFNAGREAKHSVFGPSVGLGTEYKFNPTWGLGLDYTFRQVSVTGNTKGDKEQQNLSNLLRGFQHEASAYLTLDLFNLFIPRSKTKLFALNLIAGGSFMAFRNTNQTPAAKTVKVDGIKVDIPNFWKNKTGTPDYQQSYPDGSASRTMDKYDFVGGFLGGVSFDFNVSRDLAVGLRALYHFYGNDKVDGRPDIGANNDGVFDTELLLRYKIQADKKSHVNNYVNKANYIDSNTGFGGRRARKDTVVVLQRDTVEFFHRDTIEIHHKDTVEFFHRDTILLVSNGGDTTNIYNSTINYITNPESEKENYFYVYFNPDRYNLSDEALVIIQQVADRMEKEPNLYAAIIGYCDNVGSATYNKRLGQERAQNVLEELQLEYGVEADRMFAISRGIVVGKRSSAQYAPNRRVEIRLVERSFFNDLRAQYREDIELQKAYIKQRGVKQPATTTTKQ